MYDINRIRKELSNKPIQLELINLIHKQIQSNHFSKEMIITVPKKMYSSKLIKSSIKILGYDTKIKKFATEEILIFKTS